MTGDESLFQELDKKKSGNVFFGDNSKGIIRGIGIIGNNSHIQIKNVLLIENLKLNVTKALEFVLKQMHAMLSIHLPIKSFTLEKA